MANSFPYITANILTSKTPISVGQRSILLVGGMVAGTATTGSLVEGLISEANFNDSFGKTSQIAKAGRAIIQTLAYSRTKPIVSAIGLVDNGSGVSATGTIAFSGTATTAGTITIYIDSLRNGKFELAVAVGDTASVIGGNLATAINAYQYRIVNAVNTTGSVALTAINKGTQGNTIGLKYNLGTTAGITITLTTMANGATDPSLTTLFDAIADKRFTTIICPAEWGTSTLTNLTEARFNVDNKILDGLGIVCKNDTYANSNTALDALNQKTLAYIPNKLISGTTHKGGGIFESPLVISAIIGAIRELRLTVDSNVSNITTNNQGTGGSYFGAIPYHNTPLLLPVIETGNDFSDTEALELENSGGLLLRNNPSNTTLIINEAVTTYKTNNLGNPDITFKYVNYVDSLSIIREYFFNNLKNDFSQTILTTGTLVAGRPMVNKEAFIAKVMSYYASLSGINGKNDYVLLRAGTAEANAFRLALEQTVTINLPLGKITSEVIANIVTQVRNIIINFTPTFE